jgi:hypothetical protein
MPFVTCCRSYKTKSFHCFRCLPKLLSHFGWYFKICYGILSELILLISQCELLTLLVKSNFLDFSNLQEICNSEILIWKILLYSLISPVIPKIFKVTCTITILLKYQ